MSDSLTYNIRWVERTFSSLATTDALLAHQRHLLTQHDYDAALAFLPARHRHYRLIGGILPIPLFYAFRKPNWSNTRSYLFLTATSFVGFLVGHAFSVSAHVNFVRSIEHPAGFDQALQNIQRGLGLPPPPGPVIVRHGSKWAVDHDPPDASPAAGDSTLLSSATSTHMKALSRWDQIRAANAPTTTSSSWDTLRQNHERQHVVTSFPVAREDRTEDRATEQAAFDQLLERERNIR